MSKARVSTIVRFSPEPSSMATISMASFVASLVPLPELLSLSMTLASSELLSLLPPPPGGGLVGGSGRPEGGAGFGGRVGLVGTSGL